jgi:iron complex outermembrane receptor protein
MLTGMMAGKTFYDTLWQQGSIFRTSVFAHGEKRMGQFQLTLSGRADWVNAKPNQPAAKTIASEADLSTNDFNTSLSAGLSRSFGNHFQMAFWLGHGVRSASITEKFINYLPVGLDAYEVVGNTQLKPEANTQLDLLLRYKTENALIQLNFYHAFISQLITTVVDPTLKPVIATSPGVRKYINVADAKMMGFELSYHQQIAQVLNQELTLAFVRGQNKVIHEPLPEINPFEIRYKLAANLMNSKLQPYFSLRHSFAQNRISTSFNEKATGDFTVMDLGIKAMTLKKVQFTAVVQNIFNISYREHLSRYIRPTLPLNAPGRSLVLMFSYQF